MPNLQGLFRNGVLTQLLKNFNKSISRVRLSVLWLVEDIINYFKFMDLKIALSCIGKMHVVCTLLCSAFTCLYGNLTSKDFGLSPSILG